MYMFGFLLLILPVIIDRVALAKTTEESLPVQVGCLCVCNHCAYAVDRILITIEHLQYRQISTDIQQRSILIGAGRRANVGNFLNGFFLLPLLDYLTRSNP